MKCFNFEWIIIIVVTNWYKIPDDNEMHCRALICSKRTGWYHYYFIITIAVHKRWLRRHECKTLIKIRKISWAWLFPRISSVGFECTCIAYAITSCNANDWETILPLYVDVNAR